MNKKIAILLLCVVLAATAFVTVACVEDDPSPKPDPQPTVYDKMNTLAKAGHDKAVLTITTVVGQDTLTSVYNVTTADGSTTVEYEIQTLARLDITDGTQSRIVTTSGSYVVKDGKVVQQNGQNCDIALEAVSTAGSLVFDEKYFADVVATEGSFKANVTNFKGFCGVDATVTAASVDVAYNDNSFTSVSIGYTTSNATVTAHYAFD